jgi:hypothetical protein
VEYEVEPAPETLAMITAVRTRQLATRPSPATGVDQPPGDVTQVAPEPTVEAPPPLAPTRRRRPVLLALGFLVLARGERQKAREHYARFLELWRDCDPELRPLVEEARRRMAS